jgi:GNAT superfamily N-acetyltransferase
MMNNTAIQIIEKPDWVSWDDIKQCLYEAHALNRERGINMTHYLWPAGKIRDSLGEQGVMLVALDGRKVVGTAAIADKTSTSWYSNGRYAYVCFDAVIPDYVGKGIFKQLDTKREDNAKEKGYSVLVFDTHSKNVHRQNIALKHDYKYVSFFKAKSGDHYSVVMAKWLNGCPHSTFYCRKQYYLRKAKTILRTMFHLN